MRISEIAANAVADIGGVSVPNAVQWTKHRYIELASIGPLKPFRKIYEVTVPAIINTGGMTSTRGSRTVTPNSTAIAVLTNKIVGRYLRISANWYEIAAYDGATIKLASEYAEDAASEGTYQIAQRTVALEEGIRWVGAFVNMRTGVTVKRMNSDQLDRAAPVRSNLGASPQFYIEIGVDDNDRKVFEFYPYDTNDAMIRYTGYRVPLFEDLTEDTKIPQYIDPYILVEGVLINVMRHKMALTADAKDTDMAALWRNDYRAQETRWFKRKQDFERTTSTQDDASFILQNHARFPLDSDVMTGRAEAFQNWTSLTT